MAVAFTRGDTVSLPDGRTVRLAFQIQGDWYARELAGGVCGELERLEPGVEMTLVESQRERTAGRVGEGGEAEMDPLLRGREG